MQTIVAYSRVSTDRQGKSGLGLEAQQAAVEAYAKSNNVKIIANYVEVESGRNSERPELAKALNYARRTKSTLVVAKLDRLARSVSFLSTLMNADVPFVAVDNAHANRLTLHILAAVAEAEAQAISDRTKAALGAYKARGGKLGGSLPQCRNLTKAASDKGRLRSAKVRSKAARLAQEELAPTVLQLRGEGRTLQQIADFLNAQDWRTRLGKPWTRALVCKLLKKLATLPEAGRSE